MNHTTKRLMLSVAALGLALSAYGTPVVAVASTGDFPPGPGSDLICRVCNMNGAG